MEILQPPGWPRPRGYSNGIATSGRFICISGMVGWNAAEIFESDEFALQARQALVNIVQVLKEAGARPEHIVRMTWYVVDREEYLAALSETGVAYREVIGQHYPAMTVVTVVALIERRARVEIEVTAVIAVEP